VLTLTRVMDPKLRTELVRVYASATATTEPAAWAAEKAPQVGTFPQWHTVSPTMVEQFCRETAANGGLDITQVPIDISPCSTPDEGFAGIGSSDLSIAVIALVGLKHAIRQTAGHHDSYAVPVRGGEHYVARPSQESVSPRNWHTSWDRSGA